MSEGMLHGNHYQIIGPSQYRTHVAPGSCQGTQIQWRFYTLYIRFKIVLEILFLSSFVNETYLYQILPDLRMNHRKKFLHSRFSGLTSESMDGVMYVDVC